MAVFTVGTTADLVDSTDGVMSLREAVAAANLAPGPDEIVFGAAMGSVTLQGRELHVTDSLTITGRANGYATVDGRGASRIINFEGSGDLTLSGLTLTRGLVSVDNPAGDPSATLGSGGALRSTASGLVHLDRVQVTYSSTRGARGHGGGVFVAGSLMVTNSVLYENDAMGVASEGGSIAVWGSATITETEIRRSFATNGGGVRASDLILDQCIVLGNDAEGSNADGGRGGGIYVDSGSVHISSSAILFNSADNNSFAAHGGGLHVRASASVSIQGSTIASNSTTGEGGGVSTELTSTDVSISDSTFSNNEAASGGAIVTERVRLARSTVYGNRADDPVGGIRSVYALLDHSIVAKNRETNLSGEVQASASLIGNMVGYVLSPLAGAYRNLLGGPNGSLDPQLGPLDFNDGPALLGGYLLMTHAPLAGSPVIDAGDPAVVAGVGGVPEFDQRGGGFTRVAGPRTDIGAVERQIAGGQQSADFTRDGRIDGSDFLVWQRGLGLASGATIEQGDATGDGDVDANDLAVWRAALAPRYGQVPAITPSAEVVSSIPDVTSTHAAKNAVDPREAVFAAGDFTNLFATGIATPAERSRRRPVRR